MEGKNGPLDASLRGKRAIRINFTVARTIRDVGWKRIPPSGGFIQHFCGGASRCIPVVSSLLARSKWQAKWRALHDLKMVSTTGQEMLRGKYNRVSRAKESRTIREALAIIAPCFFPILFHVFLSCKYFIYHPRIIFNIRSNCELAIFLRSYLFLYVVTTRVNLL